VDHEFGGHPSGSNGRLLALLQGDVSAGHGVYTVGLGAVGMLLPMKKLVCGGWL
jgi:hypothetical protein